MRTVLPSCNGWYNGSDREVSSSRCKRTFSGTGSTGGNCFPDSEAEASRFANLPPCLASEIVDKGGQMLRLLAQAAEL